MNTSKDRLIEFVKYTELGQTAFEEKVNLSRGAISKMKDTSMVTWKVINKIIIHYPELNTSWLLTGEGPMLLSEATAADRSIRKPKISTDPEKDGVTYVPISAQAGYTKAYNNPIFLNQLERIYMPGFPYRGDSYRIFEVAGDSMEPTLREGYFVVGEKVEQEHWQTIADYYVYVIVTVDRCIVKRLVKREERYLIAISDNDFHPQFILDMADVKEIWFVKRKIDWEMPPPKRIELTV